MAVGNHSLPAGILQDCNDGLMYCFATWANDVSQGLFWVFALLGFSSILYMATSRLGNIRALGFATFTGMIGAIWLVIIDLLSWEMASAFIIAGIIGLAIMVMNER